MLRHPNNQHHCASLRLLCVLSAVALPHPKRTDRGNSNDERLAPWAREQSHETLKELDRKSRQTAASELQAKLSSQRKKEAEAAKEAASETPSIVSSLTSGVFDIEDGVTMGYHIMPSPNDLDFIAREVVAARNAERAAREKKQQKTQQKNKKTVSGKKR